ncbi:sugar ABC transporter permease [Heyndrickxia oleronia]|uniref:Sugar ABC transporter permease n=1 Tax=Heyndrickxia oleronia TaxID=38875 RepID=A0AAW6SZI0_9BACI|nr:sugar ABC transporter permease [Heyndrickxia oleronia]MCM3239792.1 sugar ABC transporter permease [Heyndrickxia oleronia]MDH5162900.1 sugar ABC transporter permease [Heyndrickxia oleronia]
MAFAVRGTPKKWSWENFKQFMKDYGWCYAFIALPFLLFLVFTVYPLITAFIMSFQEYGIMESKFIGLDNYKYLLENDIFWKSMKNTVIYTIGTVPVNIIITFFLALMIFPLNKRSQTFFKASFYLPAVTSGITMSLIWLWMFDPTQSGLMNIVLGWFGIDQQMWLASSSSALFSIMLMTYIGGHGSGVILYLAAMGGIPRSLYEAADIDAASWWSKLKNITWPLLKPTTLYMLITGVIGSFQVFEATYVMTQGGPNFATTTIAYLIYQHAFQYYQFGLASAEAFILGFIIIVISILQFKYMSSDVEY